MRTFRSAGLLPHQTPVTAETQRGGRGDTEGEMKQQKKKVTSRLRARNRDGVGQRDTI